MTVPSALQPPDSPVNTGGQKSRPGIAARRPRVLAADDQQDILDAICLLLRPQGYEVDVVRSPELVRQAVLGGSYDAVLIDLNYTRDTTSGGEGLNLLAELKREADQ